MVNLNLGVNFAIQLKSLLEENQNIAVLQLNQNKIGDKGIQYISEFFASKQVMSEHESSIRESCESIKRKYRLSNVPKIATYSEVVSLEMRENMITDIGATALFNSLKHH